MLNEWKKAFNIESDVRFGPIIDKNGIKLFYNEDQEIQQTITQFRTMIEAKFDFRGIILAGYAGVGKTTLLHYMKSILDSNSYALFIINGEESNSLKNILMEINSQFDAFFDEIIDNIESNKNKTKEVEFIKKNLDKLNANKLYEEPFQRIKLNIATYNKIFENQKNEKLVRSLYIVLDQIDLLDNKDMLEILRKCFSPIIQARCITAIISARPETLESSQKSITNFFATNFGRSVEIKNVPSELVLKKRLESASNSKISISFLREFFSRNFCDLMDRLQNNNIRKILEIYEKIMNLEQVLHGGEATKEYTEFLFRKGYINNLYQRINPKDSIPMIKIVFDALQYHSFIDSKFFRVLFTQTLILDNNSTGCTEINMRKAIEFLKNNSFISESFEISNQFNLTPKGKIYIKLINTSSYEKYFCSDKKNKIYYPNCFSEIMFEEKIGK
jgi:GTPase SAR1 family protein